MPQPPQLAGSLAVSTQRLPQRVTPGVPPQRHWLLTHWPPLPHTFPQPPQLLGSTCTKVHVPPHSCCCGKQEATQEKPLQTCPLAHTRPQAPQLLTSLRDTQVLPHRNCVAKHWQVAAVQVPPLHELPHAPHEPGSVWVLVQVPLQVV